MNPYAEFLLKKERNERAERCRLSERTIKRMKAIAPELIHRFPGIRSVIVFGSAAGRRMTEESDVDVYIEPVTASQYWGIMSMLHHCFGRDVDVLTQNDDPFLIEEIKRSGEVIYG